MRPCRDGHVGVALVAALVACTPPTPPPQPSADYPLASAGPPADPLATALAFTHRAVTRAREQGDVTQLACLRSKQSKLEALDAERPRRADADEAARALQSEAERCVGGK